MKLKIVIGSKKSNLNSNDWIEIILLSLMFIVKITPQLQYTFAGFTWSLMYHVVFALWFVLTLFRSPNWMLWTRELQSVFLWLLYLFFTFILFSNTQWGYFSLLLSFWEPLIIFYYYTQIDNNPKKRELIAWIAIIALAYGLFQSIQSVNANELAAREASSGHSSDDAVLTGNYSFTAAITILIGAMLCFLQTHKVKLHKIKSLLAVFMVVGAVVFVFKCNLMISILSMIMAILLYILLNGEKRVNFVRIFLIVVTLAIIFPLSSMLGGVLANMVDTLANLIGSDTISERATLISTWLRVGSMGGNLESRVNLCLLALNTFVKNPIFGIGPQNNANIYFMSQLGLHATFFDEWARFGIVGMIFLIIPFVLFYKYTCKIVSEGSGLRAVKTGVWIFLIISMLNPVASANVGISLFYILPVIVLEDHDTKKDSNICEYQDVL